MNKTITATVKREDFTRYYLVLWNGMLKMTEKELDLVEALVNKYLELSNVITDRKYLYEFLFNNQTQKDIRLKIGMKEQTFHNYKTSLRNKGVILMDKDGNQSLNEKVIPVQEITFKFKVT